jgi:hypothetical protein
LLTLAASSMLITGCDDGANEPTSGGAEKPVPAAEAGADGGEAGSKDSADGPTTAAEPEPAPEEPKDVYGAPRMMDDGAEEPVKPREPQKTIYGGPRMMEGGPPGAPTKPTTGSAPADDPLADPK